MNVALVVATNGITQICSLASAIVIIRSLEVHQYAVYGIAMSVVGILATLADSGAAQSVTAFGNATKEGESSLRKVVIVSLDLLHGNSKFAILTAVGMWLVGAWNHVYQASTVIVIAVIIVAGFYLTAGANVYRNGLLLREDVFYCQQLEVFIAVARLILLVACLTLLPNVQFALLLGIIVDSLRCKCLRDRFQRIVPTTRNDQTEVSLRPEIKAYMRRCLPWMVYNAFYPQILFLLLTLLGTTQAIAEAAALSKLHQFFLVVTVVCNVVICPFVAKATHAVWRKGALGLLFCFTLAAFVSLSMVIVPDIYLYPIGQGYGNSAYSVRLLAISSAISVVCSCTMSICAVLREVPPPRLMISTNLLATAVAVFVLKPTDAAGYFWGHLFIQAVTFVALLFWVGCVWAGIVKRGDSLAFAGKEGLV